MKSIVRIVCRYVSIAFLITIIFLLLNLFVFGYCIVTAKDYDSNYVREIADSIQNEDGTITIPEETIQVLDSHFVFAMLLDDNGNMLWSYDLPDELNHPYSLSDITTLSKWYLSDYPVWTWNCEEGILILGKPKGSIWKFNLEYPEEGIDRAIVALPLCNLILLSIFCLFFGWRFYHSLKPVAQGIESLSSQKKTLLKEKGLLRDLTKQINHTSVILEDQNNLLAKRDDARTQWIAGVSHDIRTPLSMIMGYADTLSKDSSLSSIQKEQLEIIKNQSIQIKSLIEDLNLTSKLEYQMQPLHITEVSLSAWLRQLVADYYNVVSIDLKDSSLHTNPLSEQYSIELSIDRSAENLYTAMDDHLMKRAFHNLIGNSIRHNEEGCDIRIHCTLNSNECQILYEDNGKGLPVEVLQAFFEKSNVNAPHIMGLYLVDKILTAHGGSFLLSDTKGHGMSALLSLPIV